VLALRACTYLTPELAAAEAGSVTDSEPLPCQAWAVVRAIVSVPSLPTQELTLVASKSGLLVKMLGVVEVSTFKNVEPAAFWIWKAVVELVLLLNNAEPLTPRSPLISAFCPTLRPPWILVSPATVVLLSTVKLPASREWASRLVVSIPEISQTCSSQPILLPAVAQSVALLLAAV
jgi:hypothetical protein